MAKEDFILWLIRMGWNEPSQHRKAAAALGVSIDAVRKWRSDEQPCDTRLVLAMSMLTERQRIEERIELLQHGSITTSARRGGGQLVDTSRETIASMKEQLEELDRQLANASPGRRKAADRSGQG